MSVLNYNKREDSGIASAAIKPQAFAHGNATFDDISRYYELEQKFPELKDIKNNNARREFISQKIGELRKKSRIERRELDKRQARLDFLKEKHGVMQDVFDWAETDLRIERPDVHSFRLLRKSVSDGSSAYFSKDVDETPSNEFEKEVFRFAEILMIEHDWASALDGADIDAVVKLPYEVCAFEFKFSGRAVIGLATQFDDDIAFCPMVASGNSWFIPDFVLPLSSYVKRDKDNEGLLKVSEMVARQIKAACIALDAEVAKTDLVREPHIGSHGKNIHQPLKGYHVISLSRRSARPPLLASIETGKRIRLHFRRGHWRHFDNYKTWIKWMLVGDPDLGFVDKHYRL